MIQKNEYFRNLVLDVVELGYNYAWKWAYSLKAAGSKVYPPITYILLCICWILGTVKYWYIHHKKADNHLLGHTVSGLYILLPEFYVSYYFFDFTGNTRKEIQKKYRLVDYSIYGRFLYGRHVPQKARLLLSFSSIIHNNEYINRKLHVNHKLCGFKILFIINKTDGDSLVPMGLNIYDTYIYIHSSHIVIMMKINKIAELMESIPSNILELVH